ncbi:MAG: PEP/pyruvate-binding domain-containing protein [Syntrophotaleaceae bacterium]
MTSQLHASTGFAGLDHILDYLRIGDNVVWRTDSVEDYQYFVSPFVDQALREKRKVVYMRFASHKPLLKTSTGITTYKLDAYRGFEPFSTKVYNIITDTGPGAFYVFDCLSDLLMAWATDGMIGNFFQVTCPYLFELDTVAYFALIRNSHSFNTMAGIRETTQVLLDLYKFSGQIFVHPAKVWQRHSPTMFLPHVKQEEQFVPVANSYDATNLTQIYQRSAENARRQLDYWDRLFLEAEELVSTSSSKGEQRKMIDQLCRIMIGHDDRMLSLARDYFSLEDLLEIKSRTIGSGYIGGKSVGMLLARKMLLSDFSFYWQHYLEPHDSFYIGSDIYFSYIVHNGWWKLLMQQKTPEGYFEIAPELKEKLRHGTFDPRIREKFREMLEHFGQYPIIVRSSSVLEDSFGNAFAGKYESFFRVNQGSPEQRYEQFEDAVRQIFASTMSEDALAYRRQRGLDRHQEQMALLVQRVSGAYHEHFYFPEMAGVGASYNTFVWDRDMDPTAGMLRLVMGLGTRAVDRVEGDYPRIVALDNPLKTAHKNKADIRRFSQRDVDVLNVSKNSPETIPVLSLLRHRLNLKMERFVVPDRDALQRFEERGIKDREAWLLTFEKLLSEKLFSELMQNMLKTLEKCYNYPVDIEFTVNFSADGTPRINLVQCRPLQTRGLESAVEFPHAVSEDQLFFQSEGHFMGGNISRKIRSIIWIEPERYCSLPMPDRYEIARLIGRINKTLCDKQTMPTLLMGPGRWGTSTPSLGVPVNFSEINNITALAEVAFPSGGLMPELSFGTHFFQDLVETEIFYLALFPEDRHCTFNHTFLETHPNSLTTLLPESGRFSEIVKILDLKENPVQLMSNVVAQRVICFF